MAHEALTCAARKLRTNMHSLISEAVASPEARHGPMLMMDNNTLTLLTLGLASVGQSMLSAPHLGHEGLQLLGCQLRELRVQGHHVLRRRHVLDETLLHGRVVLEACTNRFLP